MASGAVEKAVMPSMEYRSSLRKLHFVSPATRSRLTYSSQCVLNPTQEKMPLEKRLYSLMDRMASTMRRVIKR